MSDSYQGLEAELVLILDWTGLVVETRSGFVCGTLLKLSRFLLQHAALARRNTRAHTWLHISFRAKL